MSIQVKSSQSKFLLAGGIFEMPLAKMYEDGTLTPPSAYVHQEYPKWIEVMQPDGSTRPMLVHDLDEDRRVSKGGPSDRLLEEKRQELIAKARYHRLQIDPQWSFDHLEREINRQMDQSDDVELTTLRADLARREEKRRLREQIAALDAQEREAETSTLDTLRAELMSRGVKVDGRWSETRMREELSRIQVTADE